jgi:hypothetical protein
MRVQPVLALALAAVLVTAGCQAPVSPRSPTTETTAEPTIQPEPTTNASRTTTASRTSAPATAAENDTGSLVSVDGELSFNATRTYYRVGRMVEVPIDERPPTSVRVVDPPNGSGPGRSPTTGFTELLGIVPPPSSGENGGVVTGAFARGTAVTLYDHPNASETRQETILAHEFLHVYQSAMRPGADVGALDRNRNREQLRMAMVEGSAEYVQERYAIRYQNASVNQTAIPDAWTNASAFARLQLAAYEYGSRYFALRIDDPAAVRDVYRNPPRTTEQLLHGDTPDEEPTKSLTVVTNTSNSSYTSLGGSTKGELFTRIALSTELDWNRSARAASGWGMDRLTLFSGQKNAYAWTLRWDDASEADEFQRAFEEYAAAKESPFRLERVSDQTVVVFAGTETFVANATATGNDSSVTITA